MPETYVIDDPAQVRAWDAQTVAEQAVPSLALMERAAVAFVDYFADRYPEAEHRVVDVLCGPGNNGGDGAAIARLLLALGYDVHVWGYWTDPDRRSADLAANWTRLEQTGGAELHLGEDYRPSAGVGVIVDALFGVGLDRPLGGVFADTVRAANDAATLAARVSVDVPSGQRADGSEPTWPCFDATKTVTFGALKQAALLPETGPAWGSIHLVDIDLAEPAAWVEPGTPRILTPEFLVAGAGDLLGLRDRFTHKGTYGHVLVVAGSRGHAGAALLCGRGAYRAGAGLVTFYAPAALEPILQASLPEAMALRDPDPDVLTAVPPLDRYDAVVVGPGIGQDARTAAALAELFVAAGDVPCVIDADALNLVAADDRLRALLPRNSVLTPHPGEFARLAGETASGHARLQALRAFAKTLPEESVAVLKDQYTAIATADGRLAVNFFDGNPGMATGGMGDVLAGAIGGLAARAEDLYGAACLAVAAHARAGDLAAAARGQAGVLAGDVAERVGEALGTFA